MDYVDLHTHSNASDGTCSPAEVVIHAADKGLRAIALTDHDTVSGIDEAIQAAATCTAAAGHPRHGTFCRIQEAGYSYRWSVH